jgi:hypothetical protein
MAASLALRSVGVAFAVAGSASFASPFFGAGLAGAADGLG